MRPASWRPGPPTLTIVLTKCPGSDILDSDYLADLQSPVEIRGIVPRQVHRQPIDVPNALAVIGADSVFASAKRNTGPLDDADGVAVQERADEAVLLAVGFDVRIVGPDGETELTVVVIVGGR